MWNAIIVDKQFSGGVLVLNIRYTNGKDSFNEIVSLVKGTDLNLVVDTRLKQLEATEAFAATLTVDVFTPVIEAPIAAPVPEETAITKLAKLNYLLELKVIDETDPDYQQALTEAKADVDKQVVWQQ